MYLLARVVDDGRLDGCLQKESLEENFVAVYARAKKVRRNKE